MKRVWLIRITLGLSGGVAGWLVFEIVRSGISGASVGLLAYATVVFVTCWAGLRTTSVEAGDQKRPAEEAPKTSEGSTPEEIILNAIRTKGKAKRADLLPVVEMSKSSLVRLLDGMENKGLIVQVGDKKAAYYTLKGPGP